MYVVAPMTTLPTLTAARWTGAIPAIKPAWPCERPRASAANAAYVGALSNTDERRPDAPK